MDLQRKLERVMVPGSLQFASAPQQLPVGRPVFSASLVGGCGFAVVDSVRESGTATPERYRRGSRSGLATSQEKTCSHSPSKGSVWVRRQPSTRFLRSCSRYRLSSPAAGSGTLLSARTSPAIQRSTEKVRRGVGGILGTKGEQLTAQRKTACCNCSTCWNRRMGSRACATSVSSCCCCADRTLESIRRCSRVFAGS